MKVVRYDRSQSVANNFFKVVGDLSLVDAGTSEGRMKNLVQKNLHVLRAHVVLVDENYLLINAAKPARVGDRKLLAFKNPVHVAKNIKLHNAPR
jgi:hypothetical protein